MHWPKLSIRVTLTVAILAGVVLPALVMLFIDGVLARRSQGPVIEGSRRAAMALATAAVAEPAWTLSSTGLTEVMERILADRSVCAVEILGLPAAARLPTLSRSSCHRDQRTSAHEAPVLRDGETIARLRISFDDTKLDDLLQERRQTMVWVVVVQAGLGALVLSLVLTSRLLQPIERLKQQAHRLATHEPLPHTDWGREDELGELGQDLIAVHGQIHELIGELERKNVQLHQMAMYDHLTGLPNRTLLRELFNREAAAVRRSGAMLALLFIDLDQFKAVNDAHGHAAGDELLIAVGARMKDALRESDVVCRMGGDEFLVLLPGVAGWEQVAATADRVLACLDAPLTLTRVTDPLRVHGSVGIAMYPNDGADFDALVRAADLAMYRSKDLGRARYSFYHADLDTSFRARLELERELIEAIAQDQLVLHYQAVVDARSGRITGCEALVRWLHPRRGLLAPGAFVQAAEEAGLIQSLGQWVLDHACAQLARWKAGGYNGQQMAVNVSALQIAAPGFMTALQETMQRHEIGPGELTLELTESTLLVDGDAALDMVHGLRLVGADLAVDDFGTGYSSLSYLKRLRPDVLKIDRSFVRDLPDDADDCALTLAILGMAKALSITVLAEGVETERQSEWLVAQGCNLQQGYLWARPTPAAEFEARLTAS